MNKPGKEQNKMPVRKEGLFNLDINELKVIPEREARSPLGIIPLLERHFGRQPVRILEIGVFQGGLTKAFAASSLNIAAYEGVDPYMGTSEDAYKGSYWDDVTGAEAVYRKAKAIYDREGYQLHRMTSCQYCGRFAGSNKTFHIIYVDGDHRFRQALWDMWAFSEMLTDDGVMLVDDYANVDNPDVTRAVNAFLKTHLQSVNKIGCFTQSFQNQGKYIPVSQTTVCFTLNKNKLPRRRNEQAFLLKALVRDRLKKLAETNGIQRLAVFGAGKHSRWLETCFQSIASPVVVAVVDDNPDVNTKLFGCVPEKAAGFPADKVDAIILSTDCSQESMTARCRELYGNEVKLIDLYYDLPQGPYEKG